MGSAAFKGARVNPDGSIDYGTPRTPRTARRSRSDTGRAVTKDTYGLGRIMTTPHTRSERLEGVNGNQATPGGKRLEFAPSKGRDVPTQTRQNGEVQVADEVAERVSELANRAEEAQQSKAPTRQMRRAGGAKQPYGSGGGSGWRNRVEKAMSNAGATISVAGLLSSGLSSDVRKTRNYFDSMPLSLEESLDVDYEGFVAECTKVEKVFEEARRATGKDKKRRSKTPEEANTEEAAVDSAQALHDAREGVEVTDGRISSSLTAMEGYLSRANEDAVIQNVQIRCPNAESQEMWMSAPENKPEVMRMISEVRSGGGYGTIALLVFAGDLGPMREAGRRRPLYSIDPFDLLGELYEEQRERDLAAMHMEANEDRQTTSLPSTTHIEGMCVGARMMTQLQLNISEQFGANAFETIKLIMVVSDATQSTVVKDMRANNFYGFAKQHVLFINQHSYPGFRYVPELRVFREDPTARSTRYGSGFAIEQLTYPGEAFMFKQGRERSHLVESVLDYLTSAGVEWIYKTNIRTVAEDAFDTKFAAHAFALREKCDANMVIETVETSAQTSCRWGNVATTSTSNSQFARIVGMDSISPAERMNSLEAMLTAQPENRKTLYSATGRWMVELSALQEAMETARFTPSFRFEHSLEAEPNLRRLRAAPAVYPQVHAHDLTCVKAIRAVCVSSSQEKAPMDLGNSTIDDPVQTYQHVAKVQDRTIAFQTMVKKSTMNMTGMKGPGMVMMSSSGRSRHVIVVAVTDNEACGRILDVVNALLIPGVDEFHLVHVCKNAESLKRANTMISQYDVDNVVHLVRHVIHQKQGISTAEAITNKAIQLNATLIVVASEKLDRSREAKVGSVALALCKAQVASGQKDKELPCSILVIKNHSKAPSAVKSPAGSLSFVIGVEANSSELFEFTCNLARRGKDKIYLAHCSGPMGTPRNVSKGEETVITKFKQRAIANGFVAVARSLDGKASLELPKLQSHVQGDIIAVSASRGTGEVSKGVVAVLKDPLAAAVLVYKPS